VRKDLEYLVTDHFGVQANDSRLQANDSRLQAEKERKHVYQPPQLSH
jgi:hypothetical protein